MDLDAVYIVTEENRSAFWGYKTSDTAEGYRVSYHYGRLGTSPGKPAVKDYGSSYQRSNEISKKVREKLGKDYKLVTMDEYEDQHQKRVNNEYADQTICRT
jgi:predicted DNA-binding WGR domain protein